MSLEENKALVRRIAEEVFSRHNPDAVDELYAPDFVNHSPGAGQAPDRDAIKRAAAERRAQGSNLRETIDDVIAEGDLVVERYTLRMTHTAETMGPSGPIPPTGKQLTVTGIAMFRVRDGKAVERWACIDTLGLFQQLGAVPAMAQAAR